MSIKKFHRTAKDFQRWLQTYRSHVRVGRRCQGGECPLAEWLYLTSRVGAGETIIKTNIQSDYMLLVYGKIGQAGSQDRLYKTPQWAIRFLRDIDDHGEYGDSVTARQALQALHRALTERSGSK